MMSAELLTSYSQKTVVGESGGAQAFAGPDVIGGNYRMVSLISWLDASTEENSRMQELVKLFRMPETIDDLGVGQLRDVISNSLFPGTSVLHLGARYMLLVPWAFLSSRRHTKDPDDLRRRAEESERELIGRLRQIGETSYIGRDAGRNVRQLPSAAYWSALRRYGIVNTNVDRANVASLMCADLPQAEEGEEVYRIWHPSIPSCPQDFPQSEERGLTLTPSEARWLQERILSACEGTLLGYLVAAGNIPESGSWAPWLDPVCLQSEGEPALWLRDAEAFSFIHNGANTLYQQLLAERSRAASNAQNLEEHTTLLLERWEDQREEKHQLIATWNVDGFIGRAKSVNQGINGSTTGFVRAMTEAALTESRLIDNQMLRNAVVSREMLMKRANSRFRNERRLRAWRPPDRVPALTFRWQQVRKTVLDIHSGLNGEEVNA